MSLNDVLKNHTPEENVDSQGFDILKGTYMTAITKLAVETNEQFGDRYQLELTVNEVLEGNGSPGRKFWKRYRKDEEGLKRLMNDLFTAGLDFSRNSVEDFESAFGIFLDAPVLVRAWGWTPEKKMDGTVIPEEERTEQQIAKIVSKNKSRKTAKASTPF